MKAPKHSLGLQQIFFLAPALFIAPMLKASTPVLYYIPIIITIYVGFLLRLLLLNSPFLLPAKSRIGKGIILATLLCFSFYIAPYKFAAFLEWNKIFSCIVLFMLLKQLVRTDEDTTRMCTAAALLAGVLSLFGMAQLLGIAPAYWWDQAHFMSSSYVNHNHFAGFLEMTIPLAIVARVKTKDKTTRTIMSASIALSCAALVLTMSRGGWISAIGALFVFIIMRPERKRMKFAVLTGVLFVSICGALVFSSAAPDTVLGKRISSITAVFNDFDNQNITRPLMWKGAIKMINANPLGVGIGQFVHEYPKYRDPKLVCLLVYAHNDYLHYTAELGLGFLLLISVFFVKLFTKARRIYNKNKKNPNLTRIQTAALCSVTAICIHSLVDFNLHIPANAWLFTAMLFLLYDAPREAEEERIRRQKIGAQTAFFERL